MPKSAQVCCFKSMFFFIIIPFNEEYDMPLILNTKYEELKNNVLGKKTH